MFKGAPYGLICVLCVGQLLKYEYTRVNKFGFVFKMSRHGNLSYYLTIRGNITVYVGFRCKRLSFLVHLQYNDLKNVQTCPLSPNSCRVPAFCGKGGLRIDFFRLAGAYCVSGYDVPAELAEELKCLLIH